MGNHLLILDLDETLIHGAESPLDRACDFRVGDFHIYRRPYLAEFLAVARDMFDLAVWSSANEPYVRAIVGHLFPDPTALRFAWSRMRCTQRFDPESFDYDWIKDLKKVKRLGYPLERVLMIDDSPRKLARQYGNHLHMSPFRGQAEDTELRDVLPFLGWLRDVENVRAVEKRDWRTFGKAKA